MLDGNQNKGENEKEIQQCNILKGIFNYYSNKNIYYIYIYN